MKEQTFKALQHFVSKEKRLGYPMDAIARLKTGQYAATDGRIAGFVADEDQENHEETKTFDPNHLKAEFLKANKPYKGAQKTLNTVLLNTLEDMPGVFPDILKAIPDYEKGRCVNVTFSVDYLLKMCKAFKEFNKGSDTNTVTLTIPTAKEPVNSHIVFENRREDTGETMKAVLGPFAKI